MLNPEIAVNRRPIDRLSRNARIAAIAKRVQPIITKLLAATPNPVKDVLHGSVLGHPLHAVMTDVPVGAWTVTALLDSSELLGGPSSGSDTALVVGLAGATGSIVSGFADWSDTHDDPRTLGMAHALVNSAGFAGYILALILRRIGPRRSGLYVALVAYGIICAGAYIGGELSFGRLLGAKHTAEPLVPSAEFVPVLSASELSETTAVRADFRGIPLLVSRTADGVAAISAVCTHRGAPLNEGSFADGCVRCPWHGSTFALRDGRILTGPATFPQPRFEARISGSQIEVRALRV